MTLEKFNYPVIANVLKTIDLTAEIYVFESRKFLLHKLFRKKKNRIKLSFCIVDLRKDLVKNDYILVGKWQKTYNEYASGILPNAKNIKYYMDALSVVKKNTNKLFYRYRDALYKSPDFIIKNFDVNPKIWSKLPTITIVRTLNKNLFFNLFLKTNKLNLKGILFVRYRRFRRRIYTFWYLGIKNKLIRRRTYKGKFYKIRNKYKKRRSRRRLRRRRDRYFRWLLRKIKRRLRWIQRKLQIKLKLKKARKLKKAQKLKKVYNLKNLIKSGKLKRRVKPVKKLVKSRKLKTQFKPKPLKKLTKRFKFEFKEQRRLKRQFRFKKGSRFKKLFKFKEPSRFNQFFIKKLKRLLKRIKKRMKRMKRIKGLQFKRRVNSYSFKQFKNNFRKLFLSYRFKLFLRRRLSLARKLSELR